MISGTTVTVLRPTAPTVDRFNDEVPGQPDREVVENVLVVPGETAELAASRPEGARVALTLHFPKAYTASLRGCSVELAAPWAGTYRVIGDPRPYMDANTPTPWNRPVEVEVAHG
jgi:hypothetical protein